MAYGIYIYIISTKISYQHMAFPSHPIPALGATECACQISQLRSAICSELATTLLAVQPAKTPSTCRQSPVEPRGTMGNHGGTMGKMVKVWEKLENPREKWRNLGMFWENVAKMMGKRGEASGLWGKLLTGKVAKSGPYGNTGGEHRGKFGLDEITI